MTDSSIFFRILSRLEAPQLQRHCSLVFDYELHAIHAQVSQLTAAFARLQEVRDAAASLEQGRTEVTRAPSLLREVDDAASLHQQLSERLHCVQTAVNACSRLESLSSMKSYATAKNQEELHEDDKDQARASRMSSESV
ncbi:hypothetical protein PINS_up008797 [Pythium insidiosum]|nr:hypothetical protein PINS_up008797 [Pythium insidiosum]